jgi:integrase
VAGQEGSDVAVLSAVAHDGLAQAGQPRLMRPGEAVALDAGDVDLDAALVTVHGKYDRTRLVPLHPTTVAMLCRYRQRCRQLCPAPSSPAFFLSSLNDKTISPHTLRTARRWNWSALASTPPY